MCNGSILYCYKYIEDTDSYEELNSVPDYAEMLEGKYDVITKESICLLYTSLPVCKHGF